MIWNDSAGVEHVPGSQSDAVTHMHDTYTGACGVAPSGQCPPKS